MVRPKEGQFPHFEEQHDPKRFRASILGAKIANKNGASVDVHSEEDYATHKMFSTKDGMAGYSVTPQGEMVSVFKHPVSNYEHVAQRAAEHAGLVGGATHLSAFDGKLPEMYSKGRFNASSRVPWNEEYKPEGWKGDSKPDVVLMHRDMNKKHTAYKPGQGKTFADWDGAEKHTLRAGQNAVSKNRRSVAGLADHFASGQTAHAAPEAQRPEPNVTTQ